MKCRNCFTKEGTRRRSPATNYSQVKSTALSAAPIVEVTAPSDISNLMVAGTWLKDLKSSTDIVATRLLAVGFSRGAPLIRPA